MVETFAKMIKLGSGVVCGDDGASNSLGAILISKTPERHQVESANRVAATQKAGAVAVFLFPLAL